jgi:DMATS type aromatic prenyltransferase
MLCQAAGFVEGVDAVVDTFRDLMSPWGEAPGSGPSGWKSEISDDNTPVEFSVALAEGRATEVRVLFEPEGVDPTVGAHRAAGLAFNERLERDFGANLGRFRQVEDLFLPEAMHGPFAVWYSAVFSEGRPPAFKAYLNPLARGTTAAPRLVAEGLARLGLRDVCPSLVNSVLRRGPHLDELKYFALDLTDEPEARVKVYVRHHSASADELEAAVSAAQSHEPGEATLFVRAMRGSEARLEVRAPFTCSSFIGDGAAAPVATTLYVPVCAYARDDAAVHRRVRGYLMQKQIDPARYDALIEGFANRPLENGVGMQAWTAFRRHRGSARLTVYLATEANRVHPPGSVPAPTPLRSAGPDFRGARGTDDQTKDLGGSLCDE